MALASTSPVLKTASWKSAGSLAAGTLLIAPAATGKAAPAVEPPPLSAASSSVGVISPPAKKPRTRHPTATPIHRQVVERGASEPNDTTSSLGSRPSRRDTLSSVRLALDSH